MMSNRLTVVAASDAASQSKKTVTKMKDANQTQTPAGKPGEVPPPKPDKQEVTVTVHAPRSPDPKQFTWPKTMKVGEAAKVAATAFGYQGGHPGLQKGDEVLDNNKPLVAVGVRDGDVLDLVDSGGGV
jgi:hypothetical protein